MNLGDYFQSHINYFWQWEENADVVVIKDGSTIGYRAHIALLINSIAPLGLPPFGSFLLVLAAINSTIDDSLKSIENILSMHLEKGNFGYLEKLEDFTNCFIFLKLLQDLPAEYKMGKRKEILLQIIFSKCHNAINPSISMGIAKHFNEDKRFGSKLLHKKALNANTVAKDLKILSLIYRKFPTSNSIIDAMGDLPVLEETELPIMESQKISETNYDDFVDELIDNPYTFEIGTLIKPIWAGFSIPIFNAHPSEQPLGGVSDLANKGNFDKLLISEFANDDLIFMSRIANNEALYLHREMPPTTDKLQRIILIDISLKSWGTPKTLAFATFLAIVKHPKSSIESLAYVVGNTFEPLFYDSIGEVIDGLQKVDVSLHSGGGLESFLKENNKNKQLELFYITTAEVLKHKAVQKQMADYNAIFKYIITTNAEGEINFYKNKNNAHKHLQTIKLPLTKLWARNNTNTFDEVYDNENLIGKLPILASTPRDIKKVMVLGDVLFIVAQKSLWKRSIENDRLNKKGWELVLNDLPANGNYEIGRKPDGHVLFLRFNTLNKEVSIYNLSTGNKSKTIFLQWKHDVRKEFVFHTEYFIKSIKNATYTISLIRDQIEISTADPATPFAELYSNRMKEIQKQEINNAKFSILSNINTIYLNNDNHLVFNRHQLYLNNNKHFQFTCNDINKFQKITAKQTVRNKEFKFDDESTISVENNGLITLKSSDNRIPNISLISVLDDQLGLATNNAFTGNIYYCNENISEVSVFLSNIGAEKLTVVKILRRYTDLTLSVIKQLIDSVPILIPIKMDMDKANQMIEELAKIKCKSRIVSSNVDKQEIMSSEKFNKLYFEKFIQQIINHAVKN